MPVSVNAVVPFARVAADIPERPAVCTLHEHITYRALERRAGGVAKCVASTPGTAPVLLLANSGVDLAAGALGALSAGRAVIPTDPRIGPRNLTDLARRMDVSAMIISDATFVDRLEVSAGVSRIIPADVEPAPLCPQPVDDRSTALIGFTSGSTGSPRPIRETHQLTTTRLGQEDPGDPNAGERLGMLLGATNPAVRRILGLLSRGGTVSCFDARRHPAQQLLRGFADHGVTYLVLTPTYLRRLLQAAGPVPSLPALRVLAAVGEPLDWQDVAAVRQKLSPSCVIKHGYALTETSRVTRRLIEPDEPVGVGTVPVGRPRPGQTVWIVSENGTPAPAGEVGEIVIESTTIREGVETKDLPSGERRYRTGDLGRFLPDGQLAILGRVDRMIKIGGIRVEPQRIEDILREVDGVDEVAVVAATSSDGHTQMVAHLAGTPGRSLLDDSIRAHAQQHLHAAAVPTRLVWHPDGLPTLPSGKVDLVSLAAWEPAATASSAHHDTGSLVRD